MRIGPTFAVALLLTGPSSQAQEHLILLHNEGRIPREELVEVSVPFAPGTVQDASVLQVGERPTAWRTLLLWPDGSLRVALAQFPVKPGGWLAPGEILNLPIRPGKALEGPFSPHPWVRAKPPKLAVEALWNDGDARLCLEGEGQPVLASPLGRTTRFFGKFTSPTGEELTLTAFVTAQTTAPILTVDLIAAGHTHARPRHLDLVSDRPALVQDGRRHGTGAPFLDEKGRHRTPLLRDLAFGPGQGRRWRLLVLVDDPEGNLLARGLARRTWQAAAQLPLRALCDASSWLASGSLTLLGGPAFPPENWERLAQAAWGRWNLGDHFGPFGSFGLPGPAGPASAPWVQAVQTSRLRLLDLLEGYAWQQACRPNRLNPGVAPPPAQEAHGWDAYDVSGAGLAHLFAYWLATGDPWSLEELGRLREHALADHYGKLPFLEESAQPAGLLRLHLATYDPRLLELLRRRLESEWLPRLREARSAEAAGTPEMLWGLLALWRQLAWADAAEAIAALVDGLEERSPAPPLAGALALVALEEGLPEGLRARARALAAQAERPRNLGWEPWTFLLSGWTGWEREPLPRQARRRP